MSGFICYGRGRSRPSRCTVCGRPYAERECDHAGPRGGTCNKRLCVVCAVVVGENLDHCPSHDRVPVVPPEGEPFILVVCGKRELARMDGAQAFVQADLLPFVQTAEVVVVGDAEGPDRWAADLAQQLGKRLLVYALDGYIHEGGRSGPKVGRWSSTEKQPPRENTEAFRQWCLARNTVMIAHVARKVRGGRHAHVLGYLSYLPIATKGTEQTLRTAELSSLAVRSTTVRPANPQLRLVPRE